MKYQLIMTWDITDFNNQVNNGLASGWVLFSAPSATSIVQPDGQIQTQYIQAMTKG